MMKQKLALLLTALLLLTGCSSGGSGDTADGQDDGELETIDVVLDWYPNAVHAFLYEAEEKGVFCPGGPAGEHPLPLQHQRPPHHDGGSKADTVFTIRKTPSSPRPTRTCPVKVLGAVVQEPVAVVCSLAEQGIHSASDLVGKDHRTTRAPASARWRWSRCSRAWGVPG